MTSETADFLARICSGQISDYTQLDESDRQRFHYLESLGYVRGFLDGSFAVEASAHAALSEYQRADNELRQNKADEQAREERRMKERKSDRFHDWLKFLLGLILGWIFGCFTPIDAWRWLSGLFHG